MVHQLPGAYLVRTSPGIITDKNTQSYEANLQKRYEPEPEGQALLYQQGKDSLAEHEAEDKPEYDEVLEQAPQGRTRASQV